MNNFNVVILEGNLTRGCEMKYSAGGLAIGKFALAVNASRKQGEQWVDEASFIDCTVFGKTAESLNQYLLKGQHIILEGKLKQDRWEQDGQTRSRVVVNVDKINLVGGKPKSGDVPNSGKQYPPSGPDPEYNGPDPQSDIPF